MKLDEAMQTLADLGLAEAIDPKSWYWMTDQKTGWFLHRHHPEYVEIQHIRFVREGLPTEKQALLDEALRTLVTVWKDVATTRGAASAIGVLLGEGGIRRNDDGFTAKDVPIEEFTPISSKRFQFPKLVAYALSQGAVLQSAREAIAYRLHAGKDDLNYDYLTRTAAIYFRNDGRFSRFARGELLVAFDDDPFDNVLLTAMEEGRSAGSNWLVVLGRVEAALARAEKTGRIIAVTAENERRDALDVSKCIIGDKTGTEKGNPEKEYAAFIQKHRGKKLYAWVVKNGDCGDVSESRALIRVVWVGYYGGYNDGLGACDVLNDVSRARGVRKFFSTGNGGRLVPYISVMMFSQLGLYRSEGDAGAVVAYFDPFERQLTEGDAVFYAGLGACREFVRTREDLDALAQLLLLIAQRATGLETDELFTGLPLHRSLVRELADLKPLLLFYLRIVQRTPKQASMIYDDVKTLIDAELVTSTSQLADVDAYLEEFQFLTVERYRHYLSLDPAFRREYLRNHKKKYLAIALGEQQTITPEEHDLIWYAVNSKNLTKDIILKTLQRYGNEANKLRTPLFSRFDIKDLNEIVGYKLKNPLRRELGQLLATVSLVLQQENYPYVEILRLLGQAGKEIPAEILGLTTQPNVIVSEQVVRLAYGQAYEQFKTKNYLHDIAWILAVKYTAEHDFGEDQLREFQRASGLLSFNYEHPTKSESETLLTVYNRFVELYNDTIKHHFNEKNFLERVHKPKSQILAIGKELEKIVPIKNKTKVHITCIPSKAPLDLFYGYYGENCTSAYPQELFDEPFVPVRIIQMMNGEPTIEGCLHFYAIERYDGRIIDADGREVERVRGKKILAVLGVEPRGDFTNRSDPEKLFLAINDAIESQAKAHGFDYVCYPKNPTMHSNRGEIGRKISEHIRNRHRIPFDFHFPKEHPNYTTRELLITWKR